LDELTVVFQPRQRRKGVVRATRANRTRFKPWLQYSSKAHLNLQRDFAIVRRVTWRECALQVQRLSEKRGCEISVWRCKIRVIQWIDGVRAKRQMIFRRHSASLCRRGRRSI